MKRTVILFLASGFGLGFLPKAPGTFGTFLGVGIALLFPDNLFLLLAVSILGIWISHEAEKALREHDSQKIVIDEVAGYLIAAYGWHGVYLPIVFVLFRLFDILKPTPIRQLQKLPGGLGVMADDMAAGILVNLVMILIGQFLPL